MTEYKILDTIYKTDRIVVSRAIRESDGKAIILKALNGEFPSIRDITRIQYEYELSKRSLGTGIVPILELLKKGNSYSLVMEDIDGIPLLDYWKKSTKSLPIFLNLSIQCAQVLSNLHEKGILHKDIKPANILVQKDTGKVYLIDLGLASLLQSEEQAPVQPESLEGTLWYISPEQTGRMNRSIDFRSDLYSLGITFYELLTGELPFQGTDPLELVHAHIAVSPKPPIEIQKKIPRSLSDLILKLLSKNAEDRYLSTRGLLEDLEHARELLFNEKPIEFVPGERETRGIFFIPQKLYGREAEVSFLLDAFDRIASSSERVPKDGELEGYGGTKLVLVGGYSGVGKTALISEVHKPILEKRGFFLSGKFDQFKKNIPYYSLIQAFSGLVRQILTEKEEKIERWKTKILDACSPNVILLIDLIPELIHITGQQPIVNELSPREAEDRFQKTLQDFVSVFASLNHPLVLFLDDLQWADLSTLKFLESIVIKKEVHHLLLIGAYRDNEVDALHPLSLMEQAIEKENNSILKIFLLPLEEFFIDRMISDTLYREVGSELPKLVHKKTAGNPFFVRHFLTTLYRDKHLYYSPEKKWDYNLDAILQTEYSENVVEVVANRLKELSSETQEVLKVASCIGDRFELSTLSQVLQKTPRETAKLLQEASREGSILPLNETYKTVETLEDGNQSVVQSVVYKFIHDRVQQAANSLLSEEDKISAHVDIGKSLLGRMGSESLNDNIFEIVNHLNYGIENMNHEFGGRLIKLNFLAGEKATEAYAYESAYSYYFICEKYFKKYIDIDNNLLFNIKYKLYTSKYNIGILENSEEEFLSLLNISDELHHKFLIYSQLVVVQTNLGKMSDVIKICTIVLRFFNIDIKEYPSKRDIFLNFKKIQKKIFDKDNETLLKLPELEDKNLRIAMEILMNSAGAAYWQNPEFGILCSLIMVELSLEYGNCYPSAFGYSIFGVALLGFGEYDKAYQYGKLALILNDKYKNPSTMVKVPLVFAFSINNWKNHSRQSLDLMLDTFKKYSHFNDKVFLASILSNVLLIQYIIGEDFNQVSLNCKNYLKFFIKTNLRDQFYWSYMIIVFSNKINGKNFEWINFENEIIEEYQYIDELKSIQSKVGIHLFYTLKMYESYLLRDYENALLFGNSALEYRAFGMGMLHSSLEIYIYTLSLIKSLDVSENKKYIDEIEKNINQFKIWSDNNEDNFMHKYLFLCAEYFKYKKNLWDALLYYERALEYSIKNNYILDSGIISETIGIFFLESNLIQKAKKNLQDSIYYYNLCHGVLLSERLYSNYNELLKIDNKNIERKDSTSKSTTVTIYTKNLSLDIQTILKANQALSQEINLENLLKKLLNITLENAGATRGLLVLYEGEELFVEAEGKIENKQVRILKDISVKSYTEIPQSLIQYAIRTSKTIILDSVKEDKQFSENPYLQREKILSLICTPIVTKGKIIGYLYLENNLIKGAFTKDRIETLNLITAQAAISIENAKLYESMEDKVRDRTIELELQKSELSNQKLRLERIQKFTRMIQNSPNFESMAESIRQTFLEKFALSFYLFYICNSNTMQIELLRVETSTRFSKEVISELKINSIPFSEKNSFHVAVMNYGKSIFIKRINDRGNPSPTEKLNQQLLGMKSLYFIPLINSGKVFAILSFADIDEKLQKEQNLNKLTQIQREDVELLCQSIASGLYQSLQKQKIEEAYSVLQTTKNELENEKSQMERIQFMSQEIQKKTSFHEILLSLEEIVWNTYKISDYILAIKDPEIGQYRAFSLCQHWEKFGLKEKLRNVSFKEKNSIYHFIFTKNKTVFLPKLKEISTGDGEDFNRKFFGMESMFAIPCIMNNETFAVLSFSDIKPEFSRDPSIRGVKNLTVKQRKEIEQLVALIANPLYQSLQNEKIEKAHHELQATQAQLVEAEKSAALGQLISGVAHEINNPLAAIRSSAEILEMDQGKILEDIPKFFQTASPKTLALFLELQSITSANKKYLTSKEERSRKKQIRSTFESIPFDSPNTKEETIELLSDLFLENSYPKLKENFSETETLQILQMLSLFSTQKNALKNIRLSTEKSARVIFSLRKFLGTDIKGTPREVRISELIESSLKTYDNYIQGIIRIEKDYSGDGNMLCIVDEIQQVLKNLIFNAIQSMYSSPLKKLRIVVQKGSMESGEKRKIFIEDSGLGVAKDVVHKLFTPFFTTKSRGEGIGLGLYVSKLIVEEHGGRLEYETMEGGSRFVVWI